MKSKHPLTVSTHIQTVDNKSIFGNHEGYFHVRTAFYPKSESFLTYDKNDIFWKDLILNSQAHKGTSNLYGIEMEYREILYVNLRDAERMVKTLKHFEKVMEKASQQMGYPRNVDGDGGYIDILQRVIAKTAVEEFTISISGVQGCWKTDSLPEGIRRLQEAIQTLHENKGRIFPYHIGPFKAA